MGANSFMYLFIFYSFVRSFLSFLPVLSPFPFFCFCFRFFFLSKKYKIRTASRLSNLALFRPIYGSPRNFSLGRIRIRSGNLLLVESGILGFGIQSFGIQSVSPRNVIIIFYLFVFQTLPVYLSSLRRIIIL